MSTNPAVWTESETARKVIPYAVIYWGRGAVPDPKDHSTATLRLEVIKEPEVAVDALAQYLGKEVPIVFNDRELVIGPMQGGTRTLGQLARAMQDLQDRGYSRNR